MLVNAEQYLKNLNNTQLRVLFKENYNRETAFGNSFLISIRRELESRY